METPTTATTETILETIVSESENAMGHEAFVSAKNDFYRQFGKVFPEDAFYDARMSYFLDYFVLLRPVPGGGSQTPFLKFRPAVCFPVELMSAIEAFRHSVFLVESLAADRQTMIVRDLTTRASYKVQAKPGESFHGFANKCAFQGFVFPLKGYAFLGNGLIIHPNQVVGIVESFIKKSIKSGDFDEQAMLARLAFVQLKSLRHSRAGARLIYSSELTKI